MRYMPAVGDTKCDVARTFRTNVSISTSNTLPNERQCLCSCRLKD